jgi:putative ABC transport system substrate-binding protein
VKAANNVSIPVFVSDTDIVKDGAIAALGPNQYNLGLQTAKMIVLALGGEEVSSMEIEYPKDIELYLNSKVAKKIGIKFPLELIESVSYVTE